MAETDIGTYCEATQEFSGFCNDVGGFSVGIDNFFKLVMEHIFFYGAIVLLLVIFFYILSGIGNTMHKRNPAK